jgi:hypothetical protein
VTDFYIAKRTSGDYVAIEVHAITHFEQRPALNRANEPWKPSDGNPAKAESVLVYVGDYVEEIDTTFVDFVEKLAGFLGHDPNQVERIVAYLKEDA